MIYQINPKHGHHMASSKQEADYNEKHGWRTVTEQEFWHRPKKTNSFPAPLPAPLSAPASDSLSDVYESKFGKKPHHRMKPETIEAAINADGK